MILYFDGGCKPNPGAMEIGVVSDDGTIRYHERIGDGTNNEAEWMALIATLSLAKDIGLTDLDIRGDSSLVVNQANGIWKVKNAELKRFKAAYDTLSPHFLSINLLYVPRAKNLAGHYIEEMN